MGTLEPVTLVAPINNSTIYCKNPRILFNLNDGNDLLIIYITLTNDRGVFNYTSARNPELFSATAFNSFDKIVFTPSDVYIGINKVEIRVYDNNTFSSERSFVFNYKESLLAINEETESISVTKFRYLYTMTNDTLKAYNMDPIEITMPVSNESKILKNYFIAINNILYDLNKMINETYPGLNRTKIKDIISVTKITKKIYNNLLNFITDL